MMLRAAHPACCSASRPGAARAPRAVSRAAGAGASARAAAANCDEADELARPVAAPAQPRPPPAANGHGKSELDEVASWTVIVPETANPAALAPFGRAFSTAAQVSYGSLLRAVASPSRETEAALAGALASPACRAPPPGAPRSACLADAALVRLGAELARGVSGRVSTELDARLAGDAPALAAKAFALVAAYAELGVPRHRLLLRLPATRAGLEATAGLEAAGIACHLVAVFSLHQAAAAAAAGASVIQPSLARLRAHFARHPQRLGAPWDADAPFRPPGGAGDADEAGVGLAAATLAYCRRHRLRSQVMAFARSAADARRLAGADFLVLPIAVLRTLAEAPTQAGYNDGISSGAGGGGAAAAAASPLEARARGFASLVAARSLRGDAATDEGALAGGAGASEGARETAALLAAAVADAAAAAAAAEDHFGNALWPPGGGM